MSDVQAMFRPFQLAEMALTHCPRVLLWGPPSAGKSFLSMQAGLNGRPVYQTVALPDQSSADLIGCYVLRDKEMIWSHGTGIRAWTANGGKGGRLVIDDFHNVSPEVLAVTFKLADDPRFASITLPTGEVVRPGPDFQIVLTSNGDPMDLPEAIQSRFPVKIETTEPNPVAIDALPEDLRNIARETAMTQDVDRRISLRVWNEYARLRDVIDPQAAAVLCFQYRAQEILDSLSTARVSRRK